MQRYNAPFEIHVHGQAALRVDVKLADVEEALKPLWRYAGARSLAEGAKSSFDDEPGIQFLHQEHLLQICWTVNGDDDFRQILDEVCMSLNELSSAGSTLEISFNDLNFDPEDEDPEQDPRDDFFVLFIGPNPSAIMQAERDLLIQDVTLMMERHFNANELSGVVSEIDKLYKKRFNALVHSLDIGKPPRGANSGSSRSTGRKPRRLH